MAQVHFKGFDGDIERLGRFAVRHPVLAHQFEGQLAFGRQRLDGTVYLADGLGGNAVVLGSRAGAGERSSGISSRLTVGRLRFRR